MVRKTVTTFGPTATSLFQNVETKRRARVEIPEMLTPYRGY